MGQICRNGERIILFVTMREGETFTDQLATELKTALRQNLSPHHVPAKIIAAPDLPRTINNKLMEIAVKKIINHQPLTQTEAISNPNSLIFFKI